MLDLHAVLGSMSVHGFGQLGESGNQRVFVHGGISPRFAGRDLEEINREVRREIESLDAARADLLDRDWILPTTGLAQIVALARQLAEMDEEERGFPLPPYFAHLADAENWLILREDGPLWFRGYGRWGDEEGEALMPAILAGLGAEHVVVAHTPQKSRSITPRFDSRIRTAPRNPEGLASIDQDR